MKPKKLDHEHKCQVGYHVWTCKDPECWGHRVGTRKPSKNRTCPSCSKTLHGEAEHHESYGMISIGRFQGAGTRFFGSSVKSMHGMTLEISHASKTRNLSSTRYSDVKPIVRVRMTFAQFAQFITSPNAGGVPCTIEWLDFKSMEDPPEVAVREQFVNEFADKVRGAFATLEDVTKDIENLFKTGKGSRVDIRSKLATVRRELAANAPFILSQFDKQMDNIVTEAKVEVESFVEGKIRSLGLDALESDIKKALSAPAESAALQLSPENEQSESEASCNE